MELRYPWIKLESPELFEAQLTKEVHREHLLFAVPAKAIARVDGDDDYLFSLLDGSGRVAVVYLSFGESVGPGWPWTTLYSDLAEWESKRMLPDNAAFKP